VKTTTPYDAARHFDKQTDMARCSWTEALEDALSRGDDRILQIPREIASFPWSAMEFNDGESANEVIEPDSLRDGDQLQGMHRTTGEQ